jgi:hypothetical protein
VDIDVPEWHRGHYGEEDWAPLGFCVEKWLYDHVDEVAGLVNGDGAAVYIES